MFCVSVADFQNKVCYFCIDWGDYMSLMIYDSEDNITEKIYKFNDRFFDIHKSIPDTELVKKELQEIEHAERMSEYTFTGRVKEYGALYSNFLSTGTKTFLNIYKNPDKCFDVCECGSNVMAFILKNITDGKIFWHTPALVTHNDKCDILYKGRRFLSVHDFINYAIGGK